MKKLVLLVLCLAWAGTSAAFQPRTGIWFNPAESGSGFNIDIQDNILVVAMFAYQAGGASQWYLAAGAMTNDGHNFAGTLDKYQDGQCLSCAYTGPGRVVGNDGIILISFTSETAATVTLPGGRTTNIQPFNFGFGDPPQGLLGEWIFVYDIVAGGTTSAERYNFTTVLGATTNGNGIAFDPARYAICELQISGQVAGTVLCIDFTDSTLATVANQYSFRFGLDEGYGGFWVSPATFNQYSMKAFKVKSKSGVSRIAAEPKLPLALVDTSTTRKAAAGQKQCAPMSHGGNPEMARAFEEMRQLVCAIVQ